MTLSELRAQGWKYGCYVALLATLVALTATGVQTARLHYQEGRNAKLAEQIGKAKAEAALQAQVAANELERLRNAAPKAGKTIREVVHDHPSGCIVPAADKLRDAIRQSNAARGVSGDA